MRLALAFAQMLGVTDATCPAAQLDLDVLSQVGSAIVPVPCGSNTWERYYLDSSNPFLSDLHYASTKKEYLVEEKEYLVQEMKYLVCVVVPEEEVPGYIIVSAGEELRGYAKTVTSPYAWEHPCCAWDRV